MNLDPSHCSKLHHGMYHCNAAILGGLYHALLSCVPKHYTCEQESYHG